MSDDQNLIKEVEEEGGVADGDGIEEEKEDGTTS